MHKKPRDSFDYQALAGFRYEIRRFLNFSEQAARAAGLEPQQHQALLALRGLSKFRKATVGVLAERLQIQHHSAVELINRLELRGLVRRLRSTADRREVFLQATARGERILRRLSLQSRAELRSAGPRLIRALQAAIRSASRSPGSRNLRQRQARNSVAGRRRRSQ
jgi:DNA-binding MarR family transcriptional regulator